MSASTQVLFVQGGGEGAHDEWDSSLVESLQGGLGDEYEVRYPRMPNEDDPSHATWSPAVKHELAALDDGAVVVGHSVGGTILIDALSETTTTRELRAIVLIAAPFVGADGWTGDEFELSPDLGERLPPGVPVHIFHGLDDQTVPPSHANLYSRAIPQAQVHMLPNRDHQLNDDLSDVAMTISSVAADSPREDCIRRSPCP